MRATLPGREAPRGGEASAGERFESDRSGSPADALSVRGPQTKINGRRVAQFGLQISLPRRRKAPADHRHGFRTYGEAGVSLFDFIEGWYSKSRLHSSLGSCGRCWPRPSGSACSSWCWTG